MMTKQVIASRTPILIDPTHLQSLWALFQIRVLCRQPQLAPNQTRANSQMMNHPPQKALIPLFIYLMAMSTFIFLRSSINLINQEKETESRILTKKLMLGSRHASRMIYRADLILTTILLLTMDTDLDCTLSLILGGLYCQIVVNRKSKDTATKFAALNPLPAHVKTT